MNRRKACLQLLLLPVIASCTNKSKPLSDGFVTVTTSPTQIVGKREVRKYLILEKTGGTDIFCSSKPDVTVENGQMIVGPEGAKMQIGTDADVYCIVPQDRQVIYYEEY